MYKKLEDGLSLAKDGKLLVHCWRGGMRSEAMAWLFSIGGINCHILEGGYKAYRNHILNSLSVKRKTLILGGMTGTGKSYLLRKINEAGEQYIDLEKLANHKGSSFGALGEDPQPSTEHFANILYHKWCKLDETRPVWLEDESKNIGSVFLPDAFYNNMQDSTAIVLIMNVEKRLPRLVKEYSEFPAELLIGAVQRISKRLGGDDTKEAIKAIEGKDFEKAIRITLKYYDKAYMFGIARKKKEKLYIIETDTDDLETNTYKILEAAKKITW
jgi:tRNA 2-selenouridine synthase